MAFSRDSWRRGPRNSPPGLPGSASPRGSLAPPGGELLGGSAETLPACLGGAVLLSPRLQGTLGRMRALPPRATCAGAAWEVGN